MRFKPETIKNFKYLYNELMLLTKQNVISGNNFSSYADVIFFIVSWYYYQNIIHV
jgi:hypothetical protein